VSSIEEARFMETVTTIRELKARLAALEQAELLAWNGERLPPLSPVAQTQGPVTVAELLVEDRA
jgi:hypothetical protein